MQNHNSKKLTKKFEKKLKRRNYSIEQQQLRKQQRENDAERAVCNHNCRDILKNRENTEKKPEKRHDIEKFVSAFVFLPHCRTDKRHLLESSKTWKIRSFNEHRQYIDFFRTFIYPYSLPAPLVLTAIQDDMYDGTNGMLRYSTDFAIIHKTRKWLSDIVSGGSFYKKNREHFTKAEAHYFLISMIKYHDNSSIIAMYFEAKCKARNFGQSLCAVVTKTFSVKFIHDFDSIIVTGFLDMLARHTDYHFGGDELGDICDFVSTRITKYHQSLGKQPPFSFSGRTINSVIALANEWHAEQQRELNIMHRLGYGIRQSKPVIEKWEGLNINGFWYENGDHVWMIEQIRCFQELINEGRKMKHCVASYASKCITGDCGIFNVSCFSKSINITESIATIEVSSNRTIVQIKGKCNAAVKGKAVNIITRWAGQNHITMTRVYLR